MKNIKEIGLGLLLIYTIVLSGCGGTEKKQETADPEVSSAPANTNAAESEEAKKQRLYDAALEGKVSEVQQLVSSKAIDVNTVLSEGRHALMLAAFNGHTQVMELLLEAGAEIDHKDDYDRTALMYASTGPFPNAVKMLLEKGADPNVVDNVEQFSPLMFAAAEGQLEVVRILLENNADKTLKDKDGDTAEAFARQNGHTQVADLLSK